MAVRSGRMDHIRSRITQFVRDLSWHRRLLASGLAAAAIAASIEAAQPTPPETTSVVVAAKRLAGGTVIRPHDLTVTELPPDAIPQGVLRDTEVVGSTLAGPVDPGEVITETRLVSASFLRGWGENIVATPVRVADSGAVSLLQAGDRIDLMATSPESPGRPAEVVASSVPVLSVKSSKDAALGDGGLLLVGVSRDQALNLASASASTQLSFAFVNPESP